LLESNMYRHPEDVPNNSGSWKWAWALDGDENPPPSSIVSRRDTDEARRLGRIADQSLSQEESRLSGNNLWSTVVNFLSTSPSDTDKKKQSADSAENDDSDRISILVTKSTMSLRKRTSSMLVVGRSIRRAASVTHNGSAAVVASS
jgi:hypothetical protein